jgi:DNA-binding LytR/AlgR family response regulator
VRLDLSEILWIEAKSNYIEISTKKNKYIISLTLKAFHEKITSPKFVRVHRSYIINIEQVESFEENRVFVAGKEIPVSVTYKSDFLKHIRTL